MNKGFRGIWDRLTGRFGKQFCKDEWEALEAMRRDRREKDALIEHHLDERQGYHTLAKQAKAAHARDVEQLHRDVADYLRMGEAQSPDRNKQSREETYRICPIVFAGSSSAIAAPKIGLRDRRRLEPQVSQ